MPQFTSGGVLLQSMAQPLTIAVNFTANPTPTITWSRDGTPLTGSSSVVGNTGVASLSVQSSDTAGNYTVTLSNLAGSITYSVVVKVNGML